MRTFNGAARTSSAPAGVYSKGLPPMWCWCRGAALLVALWGCTAVAEQLQVRWRWDGPGTLVVECAFPAPRFAVREGRSVQLPPESRWAFRLPQQPFYGFAVPLECPPEARLQGLEIVEQELLPLPAPPALLECRECAPVASTVVELVPLGFAGSSARAVLRLLPYRAVRDSLQAIRQLRVRLSLPSVARFAVVDALASVERVAVARTLQPDVALRPIPTAPDGWQYKLYVSRQGLVRLTARELAQLGLPIATLELQTLQLWNRGQQVPLYVYDRNNNGRLEHYEPDPDYIAFFAEPNLKNFQNPDADQYRDPESDENVYVLTWGTAPGARMVEESGELRITDPRRATDLRGKYFLSTVILEENRVQERFGAVETWDRDLLQPSFRGDQLFWARVAPNASVTRFRQRRWRALWSPDLPIRRCSPRERVRIAFRRHSHRCGWSPRRRERVCGCGCSIGRRRRHRGCRRAWNGSCPMAAYSFWQHSGWTFPAMARWIGSSPCRRCCRAAWSE
jgi:hypothetical protein